MKKLIFGLLLGFNLLCTINFLQHFIDEENLLNASLLGALGSIILLIFTWLLIKQQKTGNKIYSLVFSFIIGAAVALFIAPYKDDQSGLLITIYTFVIGLVFAIIFLISVMVTPKKTKKEEQNKPSTPEEIAEEQMRKLPYTMEKGENNTIIIKAKAPSHLTEEEKIEFEMNHDTVILHCFTKEQINHFRKIDEEIRKQRDLEDQKLREDIIFRNENARNLFLFIVTTLDEQDSSSRAAELLEKALGNKKLFNNTESLNEVFIKVIQGLDTRIRGDARKWADYFKDQDSRFDKYLGEELERYKDVPVVYEGKTE